MLRRRATALEPGHFNRNNRAAQVSKLAAGYVKPSAMKGLKVMPATLVLYQLSFIAISLLQDDPSSDFQGFGKQLLGGFVLAVALAVAYTFIKLRLRDRKPPAQFISISSIPATDETSKVSED